MATTNNASRHFNDKDCTELSVNKSEKAGKLLPVRDFA